MRIIINLRKKYLALLLTLCSVFSLLFPLPTLAAAAPVGYMPGVTEEMTDPTFWSDLTGNPDALLATAEDIARINQAAIDGAGTNRRGMKNLKDTYNGVSRNESLQKSTQDDANYYLGWVWDQSGHKMTQEDFDAIIQNCVDPNAAEEMPVRWGIAVNRTELITFPWDGQILDDPVDFDFDYQPLVGIRVNEPVAIYSTSADGRFFQVSTSCCTGWARVEDIAVCKDKEEWLSAWDIPAEKRLVFWGDKMYTDYSNTAEQTVCRLITMGTVLERMDEMDMDALVINRLPLHNYAVYLPIRNEDGSYDKTPALINARERVSEDYLPLTARNLAMVALASLGDAYGWGAGLKNEDCSSLNHTIYCCFGLDLPRNGTWQWLMDFPKAEITNYTLEEKEALLDALPMGTLLNFPGHQMMYLGKVAGGYYVVSTVSSIMSPWSGKRQRTRDVQINTLDVKRANGKTWMQALNKVYVPWLYLNKGEEAVLCELPAYHESTAYCLEKGLMDAYPSGYFLPLRKATVAEAVQMLWRITGKPEPDMTQEGFADVAAGSEHEKAALWAKQTGVYAGMDGNFQANASLTWDAIKAMTERLVREDVIGDPVNAGAAMTRAELASIARPVSEAWAARHPEMPSDPFGTASANASYYAKPCNERLASLPEALMQMAEGGYSWEYEYAADKPAYALTLMDYANMYSFIHTHELDQEALREVLSDADRMVHRRAFTVEEIELLLGDDQAAAMAHFASPGTIVMGEKGYSEKWMYDHPIEQWEAEGITPEMVIAVQEQYVNPLFTQEAAKAFSQKLYAFTGILIPVRLRQWAPGEVKPDGSIEEAEDSGVMLDVIEFCQYPDYPTVCESVSLYMLLNYYGVDVTVDQIYDLLPMGAQPYDDENGVRHGANPEREFVGDPRSEYSYGVFNAPIAQVAEQFMPGVETKEGASLNEIKAILDAGNPVLAWYVSAPMREIMYRWSWLDENGETVHWPGGEHAVVICGYDDASITYRDPNAGTTVVIDNETFLKSFNELGGRIVYYSAPRSQSLWLKGVGNARELGGYTTADGKTVKRGMLLRTAKLADATEADVERLLSVYHLAVDVDFRGDGEVEKAPDPQMEGVEYLNIHILDDSTGFSEEMDAEIAALKEQGVEMDKITMTRLAMKYGVFTDQMYVDFLSSDMGKAGYAQFFRALIALKEDRALLFHCSQGKDRTGCGAMLILFALGVDEETVMADFLLTNEYNAALIAEERAYLIENGIGEDELDAFMKTMDQVYPEFMENAIRWMTETYGSPLGYITQELGVTEGDIQTLRDRFLG